MSNDNKASMVKRHSIGKIKIDPRLLETISTGSEHIDALFGSGVNPGSITMITGMPGVGKTTFSIKLVNALAKNSGNVVLNGLEENSDATARTYHRIHRDHEKNDFDLQHIFDVQELIEYMDSLPDNEPKILVIDSMQYLTNKNQPELRGNALAISCAQDLKDWALRTYGAVFFLNHVTKKGEFRGSQKLLHIIDAHLHLYWDRVKKSETYGSRMMEMLKNRYGTAGVYYIYKLLKHAFMFEGEAGFEDYADAPAPMTKS